MLFHQITKIVRALWLAERTVCMRVCKRGCGVTLFGFSRANHASTNLKKFSSSKLDKFTLFTHSFVGWNLENRYKEGVSIFFRLSWHFKREKPVFWRHLFCKTKTDYAYKKLRVQDFATGKNFSFNQCAKQRFLLVKCRLLGNRALGLESRVRTGSIAWLQSERLRRRLVVMGILLICKWITTY